MRRGPFVLAALALSLVSCSSSGSADWTPLPSGAEPPAACAHADAANVIQITANNSRFNAPCMVAPAGLAFVIRFTNNESEQHDVAVYSNRAKATKDFEGETFTGPQVTKDYPVSALPAGDYYFECIVHPADMNGALYVR